MHGAGSVYYDKHCMSSGQHTLICRAHCGCVTVYGYYNVTSKTETEDNYLEKVLRVVV